MSVHINMPLCNHTSVFMCMSSPLLSAHYVALMSCACVRCCYFSNGWSAEPAAAAAPAAGDSWDAPSSYAAEQPAAAAAAPAPAAAAASRPAAAAPAAAAAPKAAGKPLAVEDVDSKAKSFLREYVSIGDGKEARLCLKELRDAPKAGDVPDLRGVVEAALAELFDAQVGRPGTWLVQRQGRELQRGYVCMYVPAWRLSCMC